MTASTAPNHLSIAAQLPAGAYYYLMHTLRGLLPLLLKDTPENRARRDEAAMARIAALCPANIAEAEVAALHVANAEHAKACLFDAQQPGIQLLGVLKCRAQAASMSRQSDSSLRMLLRIQAARQKTEANPEARDRAAWSEHCALNLMAQALSPPPPPPPEPVTCPPSPCGRGQGEGAVPVGPGEGTVPVGPGNGAEPVAQGEGAVPMMHHAPNHHTPVSPQPDARIRPVERFADVPDDDLVQALIAAGLAARDHQFAEAPTA